MNITQLLNLISNAKSLPSNQFIQMVKQLVRNIDGGDGDLSISLLTNDNHLVFVNYIDDKFVGSRSKVMGIC